MKLYFLRHFYRQAWRVKICIIEIITIILLIITFSKMEDMLLWCFNRLMDLLGNALMYVYISSVKCLNYNSLKSYPHQQQCRSNMVECYKSNDSFDKVECCFDIVAVFGNNVDDVFREISFFRQSWSKLYIQCRSNVRLCRNNRSTCSSRHSTVLLVWTGL